MFCSGHTKGYGLCLQWKILYKIKRFCNGHTERYAGSFALVMLYFAVVILKDMVYVYSERFFAYKTVLQWSY